MNSQERAFQEFADFAAKLKGDEKSEAQLFLIQLLDAFGHDGKTLPAGSTFEYRVRFPGDRTKFADFVWPGRVLVEMKSRGEKLSKHYQQTFDYWLNLVPHRPPYVVLCNFDELWIYDFNTQLQEPMDRLLVKDLAARHNALKFLYPVYSQKHPPIFGNNWVNVTREAANNVALAFNEMVHRGETRERARRFILQCVVSMFSEDIGLLPDNLFTELLDECRRSDNVGAATYDLLGQLFRQMNDARPARGGRFAGVDYFNGGLFSKVEPVELSPHELALLFEAAKEKWQYVQPVIFGTLFEGSLEKAERHALGAHFPAHHCPPVGGTHRRRQDGHRAPRTAGRVAQLPRARSRLRQRQLFVRGLPRVVRVGGKNPAPPVFRIRHAGSRCWHRVAHLTQAILRPRH
jgi:hypothetical protein